MAMRTMRRSLEFGAPLMAPKAKPKGGGKNRLRVAQSAERPAVNRKAAGSSPAPQASPFDFDHDDEAPLSERQRRFVEAYLGEAMGNATEAAAKAGYSGDRVVLASQGHHLLRNPKIRRAISERVKEDPGVATREERQRFYTEMLRSESVAPADRLKAAQILGKTQGDEIKRLIIEDPDKVLADLLGVDPSSLP